MVTAFLIYLLKSSLCIIIFWVLYKIFLSQLTYFKWMRGFLISGLILSLLLPLYPIITPADFVGSVFLPDFAYTSTNFEASYVSTKTPDSSGFVYSFIPVILLCIYGIGVMVKACLFGTALFKINRLIRTGNHEEDGAVHIIYISSGLPAFSFLNYIFLNENNALTDDELDQVKEHEKIHVFQKHTYDILLLELISIILWFHPVLKLIKSNLKEVHEYLADEQIVETKDMHKSYIQLLVKLASEAKSSAVVIAFSGKQVFKRISMLSRPRSQAKQKLKFLVTFPMVGVMVLFSSFLNPNTTLNKDRESAKTILMVEQQDQSIQDQLKIGSIEWVGNSVFDDETLNKELGFEKGDLYNKDLFEARLNYNPNGKDVSSIYMDNGYLFFSVEIGGKISAGVINLTLNIYEGKKVKVGEVLVEGNTSISDKEILSRIPLKSNEWFNRSKLIASQKLISELGYFDPEKININPIPDKTAQAGKEGGLVDVVFSLTELN